ncbi:hypothetical protein WN48_09695 [Eufriesea mexicana]|uniref:Uncharacterized protein n=1 Tax=Eufriesea mexicana TaxID=516756 RepID=A0A310SQS6_9HYME|nr:hypothetical protein WN48_09695 [Eufriesea mexicana]
MDVIRGYVSVYERFRLQADCESTGMADWLGDAMFVELPRVRLDGGARAFRQHWGYESRPLAPPPPLIEEDEAAVEPETVSLREANTASPIANPNQTQVKHTKFPYPRVNEDGCSPSRLSYHPHLAYLTQISNQTSTSCKFPNVLTRKQQERSILPEFSTRRETKRGAYLEHSHKIAREFVQVLVEDTNSSSQVRTHPDPTFVSPVPSIRADSDKIDTELVDVHTVRFSAGTSGLMSSLIVSR